MSILSHDSERVSMYMHRVHHRRIRTNQPNMNSLAVLDHDGLGIREALAIDDKPATGHHAHEFGILDIGMNSLLCLNSSWTWVHDEGSVKATGYLSNVTIVAVIPVCAYILIVNCEVIHIGLSRLNGLLSQARDTISWLWHFQSMPVNRC